MVRGCVIIVFVITFNVSIGIVIRVEVMLLVVLPFGEMKVISLRGSDVMLERMCYQRGCVVIRARERM